MVEEYDIGFRINLRAHPGKGTDHEQRKVCIQQVKANFHGLFTVQPSHRANRVTCRSNDWRKRGTKFSRVSEL